MNEYDDIIQSYTELAPAKATTALDADPDKAARALQLSRATGVAPLVITADQDRFEEDHRADMTAGIIRRNSQIAAYIRGNDLADHVSNDDYGNLDNASRAFTDSLNSHPIWGKSIASKYIGEPLMEGVRSATQSLIEGFGYDFNKGDFNFYIDQALEQHQKDFTKNNPYSTEAYRALELIPRGLVGSVMAPINAAAGFLGGAGSKLASNLGNESAANQLRKELPEVVMQGLMGGTAPHADAAMGHIIRAQEAAKQAKPWLDAGVDVPRGVHPLIDQIKEKTNDAWVDKIQNALQEAQNSATRERDPELFKNFAQQHFADAQMGISADAVVRLYGDKVPSREDGILGWVPGIEEKLEAAKTFGEDVHVPLADWVTYVDPQLASELKPDLRAWPGGITKNEAKVPVEPRPVVDAPLAQVRDAMSTEPMFSIGDRKLELKAQAPMGNFHEFQIVDQTGKPVGELSILPDLAKKQLYVGNINGLAGLYSNAFGPSLMRDLKRQLKEAYPEYETITGHRVSGARKKSGVWDDKSKSNPVVRLHIDDLAHDDAAMRQMFDSAYMRQFDHGVEGLIIPKEEYARQEQQLIAAMREEAAKVAPGVEVIPTAGVSHPKAGGATGVFLRGLRPQILVDMFSPDAKHVMRHEFMHHMKDLLRPEEWAALENAAKSEGWIERYNIEGRYGDILKDRPDLMLEEAIAEAYPDWHRAKDSIEQPKTLVTQAFQKIHDFIQRVKQRFAEILGHEPTFEELFEKISSGEIGQRSLKDRANQVFSEPNFAVGDGKEILYHGTSKDTPFDKFREAKNGTWFTTDPEVASQYAVENDSMGYRMGGGKIEQTNTASRVAAMTHDFKNTLEIKEWPERLMKDNYKKAQSEWFSELRAEGYDSVRLRMDNGHSIVASLDNSKLTSHYAPEPVKGGPKFSIGERMDNLRAAAAGLDSKSFKTMQELIRKRHEEDLQAALKRAEAEQKTLQSKEWKEAAKEIRKEVEADIKQRPDVAADLLIGSGELGGKQLERKNYPLRAEDLSAEQKASLPRRYYSKDGVPVDMMANLFGFTSGDRLIEELSSYTKSREGMSAQEGLRKTIDEEVQRRMEEKFGKLQDNIMLEAMDQALSETNLNILAEEWQGAAMKARVKVVDKDVAKAEALELFGKRRLDEVNVERLLGIMGKIGRDTERLLIAGKNADALVLMQRKYMTGLIAAETRKLQKEQASFEKTAKQFSKREVSSVDPEYTNYVHQILMQVGKPVRRSIQDLAHQMEGYGGKNLEEFVQEKTGSLREIPVWDQLYDPNWNKSFDQLTADEFRALHGSIKALVHNGRDEMKIMRQGEAEDLAIVKLQMIQNVIDAAKGEYATQNKSPIKKFLTNYYIGHLQMENIFNRWDGFDSNGVWNQYIMRDLIDGANQKDAWLKEYAHQLKQLPEPEGLTRTLNNPLFKDQDTGAALPFTRKNLIAVMLNTGNSSNLAKLAKGYKIEPNDVMAWVHQHASKKDWEFVQGIWDMFADINKKSETMYRSLTGGVAPERLTIRPVDTPHGQFKGGYYPIIFHSEMEGKSKKLMGKDPLEQENYVRATTPAGWTKTRTGYAAPMALELDAMPGRIGQMLHDIALRPAVLNAAKIFYDHDVRSAIRAHFGAEYRDELVPYLRGVANASNYESKAQTTMNQMSEFIRQNMITTLVGLNPGTVMKHGPTAAVLSVREVGAEPFAKAVRGMFSVNEATGESNWQFAIKNSLELQRRDRNWAETLYGSATGVLAPGDKLTPMRQKIMELSSKPVALSDMISAVPTWLAKYESEINAGATHGDAVYEADRSVRRAHGSTAITTRTAMMRNSNPWLVSIYNFFSDVMNRQMETIWKAGETKDLVKQGEWKVAAKTVPALTASLFAYAIWPAIVETWVSPHPHKDDDSWLKKSAMAMTFALGSSWVGVRDIASAMTMGRDPQFGLTGTAYQTMTNTFRDLAKKEPFNKEHAGKILQDAGIMVGGLTGMLPAQVSKGGRFMFDVSSGQQKPKGPWQWLTGLRYGTIEKHPATFEDYLKGKH